jgi:hypothetical protein
MPADTNAIVKSALSKARLHIACWYPYGVRDCYWLTICDEAGRAELAVFVQNFWVIASFTLATATGFGIAIVGSMPSGIREKIATRSIVPPVMDRAGAWS